MPAAETKRDGKGEFLAKDLSIWRQTPGPGADAGSGSRIQVFYNSPMESRVVICNRKRPAAHRGRVIFVDALNQVTRERAQSFLKPEHQQRILQAFKAFVDEPGLAKVASVAEVIANAGNLSISLYVKRVAPAPAPPR